MVLVLSMFVPAQEVSNTYIRKIAFEITFAGLFIWFYKHVIYDLADVKKLNDDELSIIFIIDTIVQACIWIFVFIRNF